MDSSAVAVASVPLPSTSSSDGQLILECAGHSALEAHILPALRRGQECATLSIGALADDVLEAALRAAAMSGGTQLHLLPGAIGGIDVLAAARHLGLSRVAYVGCKPPLAWAGSPAEQVLDLQAISQPTVFYEGSARDAAQRYPKNANVAATVSLAGMGFDATTVRLVADPHITQNVHEVEAEGGFGKMRITLEGNPLPDNPRTSALTVLSALRFLQNRVSPLTL
jgi:aspartate dehydrogenase